MTFKRNIVKSGCILEEELGTPAFIHTGLFLADISSQSSFSGPTVVAYDTVICLDQQGQGLRNPLIREA